MTVTPSIAVGILGGTGFGAGELLRLLAQHPFARVVSVTSRSAANKWVCDAHSHLKGFYDLRFSENLYLDAFKSYPHKVVFSALPHGISGMRISEQYDPWQKAGIRCIDLSGDLRIQNHDQHQTHYPHSPLLPQLRSRAAYGFTEWADKKTFSAATLVANPGCLATAAIISLMPTQFLSVEKSVTMTLATGSSGSGKDPKTNTHHPTRHANFYAYKPLYHQHEGEILEAVQSATGQTLALRCIPQSLPVSRGILCTTYLTLAQQHSDEEINNIIKDTYANYAFIRLRDDPSPELQNVIGSNFADVTVARRDQTLAVMVAIDNLGKGMAGQAIQNMNCLFNLSEKTGLWFPSVRPV